MEIFTLGYPEDATRNIERSFHTPPKRNKINHLESFRSVASDDRMT